MGWEEILSRNSGVGKMGVLTPQLQAKSWRAKPLNFQKISFGVVPHTILLGIRGSTKFFWSIDPLYCAPERRVRHISVSFFAKCLVSCVFMGHYNDTGSVVSDIYYTKYQSIPKSPRWKTVKSCEEKKKLPRILWVIQLYCRFHLHRISLNKYLMQRGKITLSQLFVMDLIFWSADLPIVIFYTETELVEALFDFP